MGEGDICIFYSLVCYIWQEHNWHIMGSQKIFVKGILVIKWLRLHAPNAWGLGSIPGHDYQAMKITSVQFSSVTQSCLTLCDPMNYSTPGLPVHHHLPGFTQTHVHWVGDAIQPSHPLSSPFPPAPNPSHHQSLFQWVNPSHEVAKVLEFQLQHQSFQWTPRTNLL